MGTTRNRAYGSVDLLPACRCKRVGLAAELRSSEIEGEKGIGEVPGVSRSELRVGRGKQKAPDAVNAEERAFAEFRNELILFRPIPPN